MNKEVSFKILKKIISNLLILLIIFIAITAITNIPMDLDFKKYDGKIYSNLDSDLYKSNILKSIEGIFSGEYFNVNIQKMGATVSELTKTLFIRSFSVLFIGSLLAVVIGVLKGIFDRKRDHSNSNIKSLQTLIPLSVPDVLVISLVQLLGLYLYNNKFTFFGIGPILHLGYESWSSIIYPSIAIALVPAAYIARISSLSINKVFEKEYILVAKGKGCSNSRILKKHTIKIVFADLIASFPTIVAMMFSSLFIVENLFYFKGIAFTIIDFYKTPAVDGSTAVAILCFSVVLGIIYFLIYTIMDILNMILVPKLKN